MLVKFPFECKLLSYVWIEAVLSIFMQGQAPEVVYVSGKIIYQYISRFIIPEHLTSYTDFLFLYHY